MKPRVYENEHKVTHIFFFLKLPYTKSGVRLLETDLLARPTKMGGPS